MEYKIVERFEFDVNTGGGIMADFFIFTDGSITCVTEDAVGHYASEDDFIEGRATTFVALED